MKIAAKGLMIVALVLAFFSCKKEQIHFQKIERVESNTTNRLNRIQFLNDTTCIIAGGDKFQLAEVLRSVDGGYTWQSNTNFPQTNKGQYGMGVSPTGMITLTGFDGTVLVSTDNGATWAERRLGNWEYHVALSFVSNNRIVLVNTGAQRAGSIVIADTNQQILKNTDFSFGMNDVQMVNEQTGYIAAYGVILKTKDGGESWDYLDIKNDNFLSVFCLSENDVWTCGYNGSIFHTTDGGSTWDKVRNGNSITLPKYHLQDIVFRDSENGYAVGEDGLVIYTSDGGKNWDKYGSFTENSLRSIAICMNGTLLVVGDGGIIYRLHP